MDCHCFYYVSCVLYANHNATHLHNTLTESPKHTLGNSHNVSSFLSFFSFPDDIVLNTFMHSVASLKVNALCSTFTSKTFADASPASADSLRHDATPRASDMHLRI